MSAELHSDAVGMEMESMESEAEFTLAEAVEMKQLYDKMGKDCPSAQFYQELADKFNNSIHRREKPLIKWEQVQDWFQDLRSMELVTQMKSMEPTVMEVDGVSGEGASSGNSEELEHQLPQKLPPQLPQKIWRRLPRKPLPQLPQLPPQIPNQSSDLAIQSYRKSAAAAAAELTDLLYEGKSGKDLAWYDVGSFLNYRHTASGELEARVRYANFGKGEDEWLNVKRCIRQRSVPLEASECDRVKVGDLIMCFRESELHALYVDARVLDIEKNEHNEAEGCTCIFVVRYDYDFSEDRVRLTKLCVRP